MCGQPALVCLGPTWKQLPQFPLHHPLYSRLCLHKMVDNKGHGGSLLSPGSHEPLEVMVSPLPAYFFLCLQIKLSLENSGNCWFSSAKTHFSVKRTYAFCSASFKTTKDTPSCIICDVTHPVRDAMAFCS